MAVEEIDLGEPDGPRQIVSGLQDFYKASELVGKKVLVVANLPTAKLGGMPSAGMVLCGSMDEKAKVEVLEPPAACEDGEPAYLEGVDADLATPNQVKKKKLWAPVAAELKLVVALSDPYAKRFHGWKLWDRPSKRRFAARAEFVAADVDQR